MNLPVHSEHHNNSLEKHLLGVVAIKRESKPFYAVNTKVELRYLSFFVREFCCSKLKSFLRLVSQNLFLFEKACSQALNAKTVELSFTLSKIKVSICGFQQTQGFKQIFALTFSVVGFPAFNRFFILSHKLRSSVANLSQKPQGTFQKQQLLK